MNPLIAHDALVRNLFLIPGTHRSRDTGRPPRGSFFAVFDNPDDPSTFRGVLSPAELSRNPNLSAGEILKSGSDEMISEMLTLPETLKRLRVSGCEAVAVMNLNKEFSGVISHRSIVDALLRRERESIRNLRDLKNTTASSKRCRYESARRVEQVNRAFKQLLEVMAHPYNMDSFRQGIEALCVVVDAEGGGLALADEPGRIRQITARNPSIQEEADDMSDKLVRRLLMEAVMQKKSVVSFFPGSSASGMSMLESIPPTLNLPRTFLGTPVGRDGSLLGCVYVMNKANDMPFSDEDEQLIGILAQVVTMAMVQAMDVTQRKRAEKERDLVARLAFELCGADTLDKLARIVRNVTESEWNWDCFYLTVSRPAQARFCTILCVDYARDPRPAYNKPLASDSAPSVPDPESLSSITEEQLNDRLLSGESVLLNRQGPDDNMLLMPFGRRSKPSSSLMWAPIHGEDIVVGVLSVQSYTRNFFTARDCRLLQQLADTIGPALARCIAEDRSRAFATLGHRLSMASTPRDAAQVILSVADDLIGWDAAAVYFYEPNEKVCRNIMCLDVINGVRTEVEHEGEASGQPGAAAKRAILEGPQLILRKIPRFESTESRPFGDRSRPSASLMYVPMFSGKQVLGVVSIQSYREMAYDRIDLELLQDLAHHCGPAVMRIRTPLSSFDSEWNPVS